MHFPHLIGAPGIFSDLLKSVQMLKGEWVPEFAVEDLPLAELQCRFSACSVGPAFGQNTDDDMYTYIYIYI